VADSRWDAVDAWTGTLSVAADRNWTDMDGEKHRNSLQMTGLVTLNRDTSAGFLWSGPELGYAAITHRSSPFLFFGYRVSNAGGGGSDESECTLQLGVDE
jgi:hypothetical protein